MPVMNGLESMKLIRQFEAQNNLKKAIIISSSAIDCSEDIK